MTHFGHFLGSDGWICVWDLANIFNAKPSEDGSRLFRMDPMNEVEVDTGADLKSIAKSKQQVGDQNLWFIQVRKSN